MKNKISLLIILSLLALMVLAFSSCGETPQGTDTGVGEQDIPTEYVIEKADGFEFDAETKKINKTVSNSIENIDLSNSFKVTEGATWKLYKDYLGEEEYKLKSMLLSTGENKAYIVVFHPNGEDFTRYELVLYRLDMKEYSFVVDGEVYQSGTVEELSSIEAPATNPQKTGYDFVGWTAHGEIASFPYQITNGVEFLASFSPIEYEINYELNGGANGENPSKYTIEEAISLVNPTRAFYEFCGWYENADFEGEAVTNIEAGAYGKKTFYAKWSPITYDINYELNGGTNNAQNPSGYNTETSVELKAPIKDGYTFGGWFTDEDFENQINGISIGEVNEKTFYAKWTANENTIVFDANGGTGTMQNMTVATDASATLAKNAFTRNGYTFKGWSTTKNVGVEFADGASYTMGTNSIYTLYAVWEIVSYDITYQLSGGVNNSSNPNKYTVNDKVKLESPTRDYYDFVGWYTDSGFNNRIETIEAETTGDKILYAKWEPTKYNITYELNGVTVTNALPSTYTIEDLPFAIPNTNGNRDFLGWYSDGGFENRVEQINSLSNVTLYAKWGNLVYNEYSTYAEVIDYDGSETEIVVPSTFNGKPVTSIESSAFSGCDSLTSIVIPDSVTSIGYEAFLGCSSLTSVNYLGTIEQWCNISFGSSSSNPLYNGAKLYFNGELVTELVIPDSVTSIGNYAFYNCSSLTSIVIPDSVTSIGESAFYDCDSLTSIVIPDSVTSIGDYAFYGCSSLTSITIGNSVTSIGNYAFQECSSLTSIVIPDSVTSIGDYAFYGCSLTSVTIGNSVTSIGSSAFLCFYSLTSVNYLGTIEQWCDISFGSSSSNPLYNGAKLYFNGEHVTELIIPNTVTKINDYAFDNCSSLTSVTIGNSVTSIGRSAFSRCSSLTSIVIPDSVTSIGESAFYYCDSLTSVTIGNSVTSIGNYAFYYCSSLTSVVIPDSVTSIGDYAFSACSSLTSVTIGNSVTSIGNSAFSRCSSLTIYCDATSKPNGWNSDWNYSNCPVVWDCKNNDVADDGYIYTVIDGIRYGIKDNVATVVKQPENIVEANILSTISYIGTVYPVTSIGSSAFSGCSNLESITIPFVGGSANATTASSSTLFGYIFGTSSYTGGVSTKQYYGSYSSYSSTYYIPSTLKNVTVTGGKILYGAFSSCSSLTSVTIGNSVTSIGDRAFYNCSSLTSIVISDSVTSIGESVFSGCSKLESITIPFVGGSANATTASSSTLFGYIFGTSSYTGGVSTKQYYGGFSSSSYYIPSTLKNVTVTGGKILYGAFYNCSSLTSIVIPDSVTSIGYEAFCGCSSLTSIVIPDSVTSIGNYAFHCCDSLTIYCEATSKPSGWNSSWNYSNCPIVWGHTHSYTGGKCICGVKQN